MAKRAKKNTMENRNEVDKTNLILNRRGETNVNLLRNTVEPKQINKGIDILANEGGESFSNYVEWLGLKNYPNMIILSSVHHYYFDIEELKGVNTIVNLKQLNLIKDINVFIHSMHKIMPSGCNFIGSFLDSNTQNGFALNSGTSLFSTKKEDELSENGITSRIPFLNMIYNLMDSKTNRMLTKKNVESMLEDQGFKVLDMTEFNGLTYFHAQKARVYNN